MEDKEIIELYCRRDTGAVNATSDIYGKKLEQLAYRILGSREDALECVNDTLYRAWSSIPPNRPEYLYAYLAKICRNIALNRVEWNNADKRGAMLVELTTELEHAIADGEVNMCDEDIGLVIDAFLKGLPKEKRTMFVRRYWYGDSIKELAGLYGYSQSKVKTTLFRLREELREYLMKEGIYL